MQEKKVPERFLSYIQPIPIVSVDSLLADIEDAIRHGDGQYAYELSLQATQTAPENIDVWILRASLARSLEERVLCVNRLNELEPGHQDSHSVAFFTLKALLDHNPFLAYLEETEDIYRVLNEDHMVVSIPKKRSATLPYPYERKGKLTIAQRWLVLAIIGLMFAGIGTLIFAPLSVWAAVDANQSSASHSEQVGSVIVLVAASLVFLIGLFFSFLFVLHLVG